MDVDDMGRSLDGPAMADVIALVWVVTLDSISNR